ncbi:ABC transporter substrate-binding protein [Kribbella sp. NPDC000426]|uniref:ABC transporter substrate-binding protein n=1 Tax=Kribbella sp. NPDC000426 TaxID=3154255 RepID=UPI003327AC60
MYDVQRRSRVVSAVAAGAMALALAVSGCQSAVKQQQTGAGAAGKPVDGGILTIAQSSDIQPNNVLAGRLGNSSWASNVFETLTRYDGDGTPQPLLAKEWKVAADKLSIEITLRDDVTFQSGRKLTADDVKYSFEQVLKSSSQVTPIAKKFKSIDVTGPTALTIHFTKPVPNIFDFFEYSYILDKESAKGLADGSKVIGTGPFLFKSWSPGSQVQLVRNDKYWGGKPHLDGITIAVITDSTAMLNAVRGNRSQLAIGMNPVDIQSMASNSAFTVVNTTGSVYPLGLNIDQPPFDKKEVRQAVNYAIDRARIAKQIFGAAGVATDLFWDPSLPGYPKDLAQRYTYDPAKAKQMLTAAGAEGAAVPITVISLPQNMSVAEIVRRNLEEVGLKPTIEPQETQSFGENQIAGKLGTAFMPLHGLNGLGAITLMDTLPSLRKGNSSRFWTDEYAALRNKVTAADSDAAYQDALHKLSEYILDQAFTSAVVQAQGQNVVAKNAHDLNWSTRSYLDAKSAYLDH